MSSSDYPTHLLRLAERRRDPLRLAMALRVQHDGWGARATYVAYGVRDVLDMLDWPLDTQLVERFERFAAELAALHAEPLWSLRRAQIQAVQATLERPRPLRLQLRTGHPGVDAALAPVLLACVQRGLTLSDVRALAGCDEQLPGVAVVRARDLDDAGDLLATLRAWRATLLDLDVRRYIDLLRRPDRDHHPDVLRAAVLRDLAELARAAMPSAEQRLEASLAELMVEVSDDGGDDDASDAEQAPLTRRGGALQA